MAKACNTLKKKKKTCDTEIEKKKKRNLRYRDIEGGKKNIWHRYRPPPVPLADLDNRNCKHIERENLPPSNYRNQHRYIFLSFFFISFFFFRFGYEMLLFIEFFCCIGLDLTLALIRFCFVFLSSPWNFHWDQICIELNITLIFIFSFSILFLAFFVGTTCM